MPNLEETKRIVNDQRSVVSGASLLIDFIANGIQALVDRKAKLEDFQEFATALRIGKQAIATAVARNTAAESSGEAEPVPAEQPEPPPVEADTQPEAAEQPERSVRKAAKRVVKAAAVKRTVGAVRARRK